MRPVRDGWSGLHPQQGGVLLAPEDVAPLIVRGPPVVDEDKLVSFAVGIVESAPLFANAALAMAALDKPRTRAQRLALALAQSSAIMATPSLMTPAG